MLNKNYRKYIGNVASNNSCTLVSTEGVDTEFTGGDLQSCWKNLRTTTNNGRQYMELTLGTGNTQATEDDYSLESEVELTRVASSSVYGSESYIYNFTETFVNETGAEVTVREIALTVSKIDTKLLLGRLVLDNPVTIANGEVYAFSYTIC